MILRLTRGGKNAYASDGDRSVYMRSFRSRDEQLRSIFCIYAKRSNGFVSPAARDVLSDLPNMWSLLVKGRAPSSVVIRRFDMETEQTRTVTGKRAQASSPLVLEAYVVKLALMYSYEQ